MDPASVTPEQLEEANQQYKKVSCLLPMLVIELKDSILRLRQLTLYRCCRLWSCVTRTQRLLSSCLARC
jgi:hypothetical protein